MNKIISPFLISGIATSANSQTDLKIKLGTANGYGAFDKSQFDDHAAIRGSHAAPLLQTVRLRACPEVAHTFRISI